MSVTKICSMCDGTGKKSFTGNPFPREKCPACNGDGCWEIAAVDDETELVATAPIPASTPGAE